MNTVIMADNYDPNRFERVPVAETEDTGGLDELSFYRLRSSIREVESEMKGIGARKLVLEFLPDGRLKFELDPE